MGRKVKRKGRKIPKRLKHDGTYHQRISIPFQNMSDNDIINYFIGNIAFIKSYMLFTSKPYERSREEIRETLAYAKERYSEDFAQYVKVCQQAFTSTDQDSRRFFDCIFSFLSELRETRLQELQDIQIGKESYEESSYRHWVFPSTLSHNTSNPFLYDFASDFFLGNLSIRELRAKYLLDNPMYYQTLKSLQAEGITPLPL